eukprot:TRINITY_DN6146_c2_g1_i1.p1 TRINITY_DN6146_c2_g1~~TRINITY_DN6146_c2_g1_i1.p1  ORF type:complete len:282 (+),score=32.36 TRINITY_DN6146_c2_g1_i1:363-1208(+)
MEAEKVFPVSPCTEDEEEQNKNERFKGELLMGIGQPSQLNSNTCETPVLCKAQKVARFRFKAGLESLAPVEKDTNETGKPKKGIPSDLYATQVLPWLYLGAVYDASREEEIKRLHITHIINLQQETPYKQFDSVQYLHISVTDHSDSPISRYFDAALSYLDDARAANGVVLVHCRQGISRSATIIIAYLMRMLQIPYKLAKDLVWRRRPVINPNLGFVAALESYQEYLNIPSGIPLPEYKPLLLEHGLGSPLVEDDAPSSPDSPPVTSPKTAPPFASLGFS